jgi:LPS O-antigen subunit length determinant protein (WzzB/FepE family)
MAAIDLEQEAFKVDQPSLKEEVSMMTSSLEKMADVIIAVRQDMTKMSARFRSNIADLKQLILNISANKRDHKQSKASAGSSSSSAEKIVDKSMDTYEDIVHDMATCEYEDDIPDQNNVSQGYSTPSQGKAGKN